MGYLRLLLALAVAISHLQAPSLYGAPQEATIISVGPIAAVKMFFILSGFYMALVYSKYPNAPSFWTSRAARLFPIYWLTIIGAVVAAMAFSSSTVGTMVDLSYWRTDHTNFLTKIFWGIANLSFFGLDFGLVYCTSDNYKTFYSVASLNAPCPSDAIYLTTASVIQPAWTLALECYFYLLVPLFMLMKIRWVAALCAASFTIALYTNTRSFFPSELYLFLSGFLACRLKHLIPSMVSYSCGAVALAIIIFYEHIPLFAWHTYNGSNIAVFGLFAIGMPALFSAGSTLPRERYFGDLSYPVYISHSVVISIIFSAGWHRYLSLNLWITANVIVIVAAAAVLVAVTRPIENARHLFTRRRSDGAGEIGRVHR